MSLDTGSKGDEDEEDDDGETMLTFLSSGAWTLDILSGPVFGDWTCVERRREESVERTKSSFHLDLSLSTLSSQASQLYKPLFQTTQNACETTDSRLLESNTVYRLLSPGPLSLIRDSALDSVERLLEIV